MFRSIRWRLVTSYVLLTLLTVSLVGVLALSLVERFVEQRVALELRANAEAVARQAIPLLRPMRQLGALDELARTAAFLGNVRVQILDTQGRTLADSGAPDEAQQIVWVTPLMPVEVESYQRWIVVVPHGNRVEGWLPTDLLLGQMLPADAEWTVVRREEGAWGARLSFELKPEPQTNASQSAQEQPAPRSSHKVVVPIGEPEAPLGYVELSSGPDFGTEAVTTTRQAFLLAGAGTTLLAALVGLFVSHGLTQPLRRLTATAARMSTDLSVRAQVRSRDEIGQLARQINLMAERLQDSFAALAAERDALRRFIADASHELRTPITALKSFNELLQGPAADDPEARDEFLAESATQLERLEWITRNLLDLSRLDAGLVALDMSEHDAGEVLRAASGPFRVTAQERGITLVVRPPERPLTVHCDRAWVELALSNLMDNALKYTPTGGRVEVGATQADDGVHFWVQDDGPGIHPDDLPHIFERFYRGRTQVGAGSGLGLSIVQSVAQAHGGQAWVESEWGAGSRFVIALP